MCLCAALVSGIMSCQSIKPIKNSSSKLGPILKFTLYSAMTAGFAYHFRFCQLMDQMNCSQIALQPDGQSVRVKSISGDQWFFNIKDIHIFEPIRRRDPFTSNMKASLLNRDLIHHPNLFLSEQMSGEKDADFRVKGQEDIPYHFFYRGEVEQLEAEKQFIFKCILCGINIKTRKFEALWNQKARDQGRSSLYDFYEELDVDPLIVDPYWDDKKGEAIEFPHGPPRYGNSRMSKPLAE